MVPAFSSSRFSARHPPHHREELLRQLVALQHVPEVQDRGLIRDRILGQLHADEAADRLDIVDRVLRLGVRQIEPLLHEVQPQHPRQRQRRPAPTGLRIMGRDQRHQLAPRHHRVHLGQKPLPAGDLPLVPPRHRGERHLITHRAPRSVEVPLIWEFHARRRVTYSELP